MSQFGLEEKDVSMIREALRMFPEVEEVTIFGSRAMGNYKPGSDVDLAIRGRNATGDIADRVHTILEERLPMLHRFDVVLYGDRLDADLKKHIDEFGVLFYSQNTKEV